MLKTGVIHGRFQILHNDHLRYLLAGKKRCEHLVVGITNPDPTLTRHDKSDMRRGTATANPMTYYQRYCMVQAVLREAGLNEKDFSVVPFPINFPELYRYYVPLDATFFLTIYDEWGEKKLALFKSLGLKTEILWRRPLDKKGLSATEVRRLITAGEPWEQLVPPAVARIVRQFGFMADQ
ncbi:MAG: nicotinate-nucleotide adenylyltransferase [Desulfobacterales bacterium]|nr:nicotinate-nucleotide adenylyltransferase [Desulfobacterales bacterium]